MSETRALATAKKQRTLDLRGKLECEACGFDFAVTYGQRGEGFMECHHTKPLETLAEHGKTKLTDLALSALIAIA